MTTVTSATKITGELKTTGGKTRKGAWSLAELGGMKDVQSFTYTSPDGTRTAVPGKQLTKRAAEVKRQEAATQVQDRSDMLGPATGDGLAELHAGILANPKESHVAAALRRGPLTGAALELNAELGIPPHDDRGWVNMPVPPQWFNAKAAVENGYAVVADYTGSPGAGLVTAAPTTTDSFQPHPASIDVHGTVYNIPWVRRMNAMMVMVPSGIRALGFITAPPAAADRDEGVVTPGTTLAVNRTDMEPTRLDAVVDVTAELNAWYPAPSTWPVPRPLPQS